MIIRTNVTNIGDPFILCANNQYYMYATSFDVVGFKVWKSQDLQNFECLGTCLDLEKSSWAYKDFWAPEVIFHNGKYIMHFSSRNKETSTLRIGVAIADQPEGPFVDVFDKPMFDFGYACIDGHVLQDGGQNYFFYSRDCSENIKENGEKISEIYVAKLSQDCCTLISSPILVTTPDRPYDTIVYKVNKWNEGPFVLKHNGKYLLTYSANFFASKNYSICLAIAEKPEGPYSKDDKHNPILSSLELGQDFAGPGHNAFFVDYQGNLKLVCHIQNDENHPSANRKAVIIDAEIEEDSIYFKF